MSIVDRMRAAMLENEASTGKKALQVIIGRAESAELSFLDVYTDNVTIIGVPVFVDRFYANDLFVLTDLEGVRK